MSKPLYIIGADETLRRVLAEALAGFDPAPAPLEAESMAAAEEAGLVLLAVSKGADLAEALRGKQPGTQVIGIFPAGFPVPEESGFSHADTFFLPLRLGALLDRVRRHRGGFAGAAGAEEIPVGAGIVLTAQGVLAAAGRDQGVSLTEKEREILYILHANRGRTVSRRTLLDEVWGYAEGIETHTLETHIYRLRQKIERDPANPALLLTDEAGYRLV